MGTREHLTNSEKIDVSATVADWSREYKPFWSWMPSRSLLASIRAHQRIVDSRWPWHALLRRWTVLRHRFWSIVTGADIPLGCRIGGGLLMPHPNGIVVHPDSEIGPNCLLFQQVTLGARGGRVPRLGGHVDIGAGAKLIGGVVVGGNALIGANSVVLDDVPSGATVVGIPAKQVFSSDGRLDVRLLGCQKLGPALGTSSQCGWKHIAANSLRAGPASPGRR